jgi:hypothetical protein
MHMHVQQQQQQQQQQMQRIPAADAATAGTFTRAVFGSAPPAENHLRTMATREQIQMQL